MADKTFSRGGSEKIRLQQVAPGEYAEQVYTRGAWDHIANTSADSVVTVMQVVSNQAPDAMVVGSTMLNPTAGFPAPNIIPFGMRALLGGQEAAVFTVGIDRAAAAPTGGTVVDLRTTTFQGRNELQLGLPIGPGQSIALYIPLGAVSAGDGTFAVYLTQEAIS